MAKGGITCIKVIMFLCNLLFALTGLLILIVGAIVQTNYHHYANFVGENIWTAPIVLIIVGAVAFMIGFLGCCGAIKESSCMITTFAIFVTLIFLAEIGLGIAGYVKHGELDGILKEHFNSTMEQYNDRSDYRDAWSFLQTELNCCGTKSPNDWERVFNNNTLPPSCCRIIYLEEANECTVAHSSPDGCLNKLFALLDSKALILGGVVLTVAFLQMMTIFFACCLCRSFGRNYEIV